jgi:DNA repair ATPase RecN
VTVLAEEAAALTRQVRARLAELDRLAGQAEQLARQTERAEAELEEFRRQSELHSQVAALYTTIGEEAQEIAREKVEALATRALQVVFGENLSFRLVPGETGGQATLKMMIRSDYPGGPVETPVLEARGGGMAAVVGFILRLVQLLLTPDIRRIMLLDETFAHVSASYEARVAELLREVVDKARVQIVLVTHSPVYGDYADKVTRLELGADGVTVVHPGESE